MRVPSCSLHLDIHPFRPSTLIIVCKQYDLQSISNCDPTDVHVFFCPYGDVAEIHALMLDIPATVDRILKC